MFPKPRQDLVPNTVDFERLPLVKPTGFREYDARWLFPEEINLLGLEAVGLGLATLMRAARRAEPHRRRPRLPLLFGGGRSRADDGAAGRRRRGARHRLGAFAHGLFRPVRARRRRRRHGHREPQRQWLDRHQDGPAASAHLLARGHDGAEGDRHGGALCQPRRRRPLRVRARHGRALHGRSAQPAEAAAADQGRWSPAATARLARSPRACWPSSAATSFR